MVLGLCLAVASRGSSLLAACGLLRALALLLAELGSGHWASVVAVHGLRCPVACGIFLIQGLDSVPCIHRQILINTGSQDKSTDKFLLVKNLRSAKLESNFPGGWKL